MGRRSANLDAFRPDRHAVAATAPNRRQAVALIAVLVLVAAAIAVASYLVKPSKARSFQLFYGSLFLNDERAPVAIDLTNGKPTVRLVDANQQVSATNPTDLTVVPLTGGTLLLNRSTGEFNLVDETGFVVKNKNGGVPLPTGTGARETFAVASDDSAYLVQTGTTGSTVYLVGKPAVQAAAAGAPVRPRASLTLTQPVQTTAGGAVSANGDLWLLAGSGTSRVVRQLHVPAGSNAGATLTSTDHGTVPAIAALAAAPANADGTGDAVVAAATPTAVEVYDSGGTAHAVALRGLSGVDQILPASNDAGRVAFLYHSTAGWSVVSVGTDGAGLDGPHAVAGIPGSTELSAPAASNGKLYTIDTGAVGRLFSIGLDGTSGGVGDVTGYPVVTSNGRALEAASFTDAYVVARGDRVVFDSPHHVRALAVFTDGSRAPLVIDKSAAADLNSAGTALALNGTPKDNQQHQQQAKPQPQPQQQVNNAIACRTTKQVPHVPTITQAAPGSRSVELHWTYPLLDPQDCVPSTYQVKVKLLSANAPSPPASVTVQGQDAVTLAGLFPSTRYELTVTAYLNGTGTASSPVQITTGPEGPAAPTAVSAAFNGSAWVVSWNSCGGVSRGCVPTTSWNVVPHVCDTPGLNSAPSAKTVAGDPTAHAFTATFPVTNGELGIGLNFTIEGIGLQGTVGDPATSNGCPTSYGDLLANQISLKATGSAHAGSNGLYSTVATLTYAGDPTVDVGGTGATVTFSLLQGGNVVAGSTRSGSYTSMKQTTYTELEAGRQYQVQAKIVRGHGPAASATIGPSDVQTAVADWPTMSINVRYSDVSNTSGTLAITISNLNPPPGVQVSLSGNLVCGSESMPLAKAYTPGQPMTFGVNKVQYYGQCHVDVALHETDGGQTPYYDGPHSFPTQNVTIPPPSVTGDPAGWSASWQQGHGQGGKGTILVRYGGNSPLTLSASSFTFKVQDPDHLGTCGSDTIQGNGLFGPPPQDDLSVPAPCMKETDAATTQWQMQISYVSFGQRASFTIAVHGKFPG